MTMYCPKCGTLNDNENIWCVYCGHGKLPVLCETEEKHEETVYPTGKNTENTNHGSDETGLKEEKVYVGASGCRWKVKKNEAKDYFVLSIISAVFGSIIFGIAAIIFSALTKNENEAENYDKAKGYSSKARLFSIIALVIGASKYIFALILIALFVSGSFFYLF